MAFEKTLEENLVNRRKEYKAPSREKSLVICSNSEDKEEMTEYCEDTGTSVKGKLKLRA